MSHHGAGLLRITGDDDLVAAICRDPASAPLTPREEVLVKFALELTAPGYRMTPAHLDPLRAQGLDDADILDTVQIIGYFAFVNRLADALGIPLEPHVPQRP